MCTIITNLFYLLKALRWKENEEEENGDDLSWTGDLDGFANVTISLYSTNFYFTHTHTHMQAVHILSLVPKGPAMTMNLKGEILYTDSIKTQRRLFYDLLLYPSDFMRCTVCLLYCIYQHP